MLLYILEKNIGMPRQPAKHQGAAAKMTWFECDQPGCKYKAKYKSYLKTHKSFRHNIGVTWHSCDQPGCKYKAKTASHLKRHKSESHDIDVAWFECDVENCDYKAKYKSYLKTHKSNRHNMDVTWHSCDQPGCNYKAKYKGHLKTHKAHKHDVNVIWYCCDVQNCEFKTKKPNNLTRHKSFRHNIGVTWYCCNVESCEFKGKAAGDLKKHKEMVHDIGEHECQICFNKRNSRNKYVDNQGSHMICNNCYYKVTGKKTRKEKIWSDYLDQHLECPAVASDKSLKSIGGCILERPDKLYTDISYTEIGECDEYEHLNHNGDYTCDEQRISKIYDEEGIIGTFMNVLRWNPDKYTVPLKYQRKTQKERLEIYVALAKKLREKAKNNEFRDRIHIYYLFYSEDNPLIAKNIPYTMIYSMDDVMKKV